MPGADLFLRWLLGATPGDDTGPFRAPQPRESGPDFPAFGPILS